MFGQKLPLKKMYFFISRAQVNSVQEVKYMNNTNTQSTNKLVVPGAKQALDQMKYEIANEFGVNLGPETSSRMNGSVGGEITKRLVQMGEQNIGNSANFQAK